MNNLNENNYNNIGQMSCKQDEKEELHGLSIIFQNNIMIIVTSKYIF